MFEAFLRGQESQGQEEKRPKKKTPALLPFCPQQSSTTPEPGALSALLRQTVIHKKQNGLLGSRVSFLAPRSELMQWFSLWTQKFMMKESAGQVLALDEHSISLLRLGVYLHSFTHALNSLLAISIRSSADTISSSIDPATGTICVDDNGVDSLVPISNANRTTTGQGITAYLSVCQHHVLDSLAHLPLLDMCSRQEDASHTHQTLFREGQVIFSAPARTSRRHNHGTTTTVRDLFHNLTVRQIREKDPARQQQRLKRQWEESRLALQSLAIVYPNITFILRNSSNQNLASLNSSDSSYRLSKVVKTGLSSSTFGKIFQQFVQDSIPLDISIDGFRVTGLFSKKRHSSRAIQLIYLDRVLIESNSSIHKSLASLFAGLLSQDAGGSSATCISLPARPNSISKSGASTVDRHPVYLLLFSSLPHLNAPDHDSEVNFLDEKEQYLIPQTERRMNRIASRVFSQVFPQVKGVIPVSHEKKLHKDNLVKRTLQSRWPVSKRSCLSSPNVINRSHGTPSTSLADRFSNPLKKHVDRPSTKSVHQKAFACSLNPRVETHKMKSKNMTDSMPHAARLTPSAIPTEKPPSLQNKIPDLKSRFEYKSLGLSTDRTSAKADQKGHSPSQTISFYPQGSKKRNQVHKLDGVMIENEGAEFRIDLSQLANLSKFTVIGQLDLKLIIAKICDRSDLNQEDGLIVAFDQHAVHERIRIERFLQEVCSGNFNVKELKTETEHQRDEVQSQEGVHHTPENLVPILVTRVEFDGLSKFKRQFSRRRRGGGRIQANLDEAVPELIWQRVQCNDEQFDFLKSILRGCLGFFEDRSRDQNLSLRDHQAIIGDPDRDWFGSVKDCPTVLVHLLNSKACRGSIMFGDKLTNEQRRKLLNELEAHPQSSSSLRNSSIDTYSGGQGTHLHALPLPPMEAQHTLAMSSARFHLHPSFKSATKFEQRPIHWESLLSD
ncbi:hypothetical protein PSHT_13439 [Puccinia striiformis]|uniref:MutL C-terminal dimerisation domain-containing protein n=2 Tax=Puccinia striiformis TaxID=27350 RepID=A0A2S4UQH9_9BASI|nr:hypothetical protein PSHT_13439 [Puccinia striiformis]